MKLGLSSYTFGWAVGVRGHEPAHPLDEQGLLDKCRDHELKLLQIGDNLPLHRLDRGRLERFEARAAHEGVQLELGARGLTVERVAEYVAIARRLNAKLLRFVVDDGDYHPTSETITRVLHTVEPMLEGLVLGIENHDRLRAEALREIIENANTEKTGICLDTANSLGAGEGLETVVRELAPWTVSLHIKDFRIARVPHLMGFTVEGSPAGGGMLDVAWLLEKLAPFRRCETAVLEMWTPPEPDIEQTIAKEDTWATQSLEYLRTLFITPHP